MDGSERVTMDILNYIELLLAPIGGVVGWFASRGQRNRTAVQEMQANIKAMQETIDALYTKNAELYTEVIALRGENAELKSETQMLKIEVEHLRTMLGEYNPNIGDV